MLFLNSLLYISSAALYHTCATIPTLLPCCTLGMHCSGFSFGCFQSVCFWWLDTLIGTFRRQSSKGQHVGSYLSGYNNYVPVLCKGVRTMLLFITLKCWQVCKATYLFLISFLQPKWNSRLEIKTPQIFDVFFTAMKTRNPTALPHTPPQQLYKKFSMNKKSEILNYPLME